MPEFVKLLLPTNIWTFIVWILFLLVIILKSKKVSTRWFSIEMEKTKPTIGAQGELILKDRLLKEYKIFRANILSEVHKLRICFRSNFREAIICYIDSINDCEEKEMCIIKNKQVILRTYDTLLELSIQTVLKPMLLNMIFRNGFPSLPSSEKIDTPQYKSEIAEFEKICIEKYNLLLIALELNMDTDWADFSINPTEFKHFYRSSNIKTVENNCKETLKFFRINIQYRDEMIKLIYKDFNKMFDNEKDCHAFSQMQLRDFYE